jgi:hypothetical protein
MVELYFHSSIRRHGVVLNQLSGWITLPFTIYLMERWLYEAAMYGIGSTFWPIANTDISGEPLSVWVARLMSLLQ